MNGFQVGPIPTHEKDDEGDMNEIKVEKVPSKPVHETPKARFKRAAQTVISQSAKFKWTVVLSGVAKNSQIGCSNKESFKNLRTLGEAIDEAKKYDQKHQK